MGAEVSTHVPRHELWRDPHGVARHLVESGEVYGLVDAEVVVKGAGFVCMWLTLDPWAPMADEGYPVERVAVTSFSDGTVRAVPVAARERRWAHRYPFVSGSLLQLGHLCLWYPSDPPALKWSWSDGFVDFVTIVHRHLMAEEYWRRHGRWPAEDAPHGEGDHPILDPKLRSIALGDAA